MLKILISFPGVNCLIAILGTMDGHKFTEVNTCSRSFMGVMALETSLLVDKRNAKSPVWRHFGFEPGEEGRLKDVDKPKCNLCLEAKNTFQYWQRWCNPYVLQAFHRRERLALQGM